MRKLLWIVTGIILAKICWQSWPTYWPSPGGWALNPPLADSQPLDLTQPITGIYPVGSWRKDVTAIGGFGPCENYPFLLTGQDWGNAGQLSLVAFNEEPVAYGKHQGLTVRLINRAWSTVSFTATDSCLQIVQEAQDEQGAWRAIEYPRETDCGNSFHKVFLGIGEYWQFPAPRYAGTMKTRLRFRLNPDRGQPLYSNEFEGSIHPGQFADADLPR